MGQGHEMKAVQSALRANDGIGPRPGESGFTLIELMMVLVIVAALLGIAGPSFQEALRRSRLQSSLNDAVSMLSFARAEAVSRNGPVTACASTDGASCGGQAWEAGWLVFVDDGAGAGATARDGALGGSEEILRIGDPAAQAITLRASNFPATGNIIFIESGRLDRDQAGTFTICDDRGAASARALVVNVSGQARLAVDGDGDGVVEDDLGSAVTCP